MNRLRGLLHNQWIIMAVCLLIPLVALIAILVFDTPVALTALVGLALICPLSHFALMRTMADHDGTHQGGEILAEKNQSVSSTTMPSDTSAMWSRPPR